MTLPYGHQLYYYHNKNIIGRFILSSWEQVIRNLIYVRTVYIYNIFCCSPYYNQTKDPFHTLFIKKRSTLLNNIRHTFLYIIEINMYSFLWNSFVFFYKNNYLPWNRTLVTESTTSNQYSYMYIYICVCVSLLQLNYSLHQRCHIVSN